jgi:hypothetical protein
MMMKGPLREVIPIGPLRARIRLPSGASAKNVHLLTAGTPVRTDTSADALIVSVPSVDIHEVIAIDLR